MNEKAILYLMFFIGMAVLNRTFNKWMLIDVIESAGKNYADVMEFKMGLKGSSNQPRKLTAWLLRESPNPKETRKKLNRYNFASLPSLMGIMLSVSAIFVPMLNKALDYAWFIVMLITFGLIIYGAVVRKR